MELMLRRFRGIKVIGFEPQMWAYDKALERLESYNEDRWYLLPYGLGATSGELAMGEYHTDACSFINTGPGSREQGVGQIKEFCQIMRALDIKEIELFICNMEGYEFWLLPHLKRMSWLPKIKRLAVQWHTDLSRLFGENEMDVSIDAISECGFQLVVDERPAWTYHVRT
jgi:FkbM family methyltransferase